MPQHIPSPARITAAGSKPKRIDEYVGRISIGATHVSIARMRSPAYVAVCLPAFSHDSVHREP